MDLELNGLTLVNLVAYYMLRRCFSSVLRLLLLIRGAASQTFMLEWTSSPHESPAAIRSPSPAASKPYKASEEKYTLLTLSSCPFVSFY